MVFGGFRMDRSRSYSESGNRTKLFPEVVGLPDNLDWNTWGRDALAFTLECWPVLKIYAVNPIDRTCYHLADFSFSVHPTSMRCKGYSSVASCTLIGSVLYLVGDTGRGNSVPTELWTWDVSEAQKNKLRRERYDWKRGPALNSPKDKVLSFSLGGNLHALDIGHRFYPDIDVDFNGEHLQPHKTHVFERLCTDSNSEGTLRWMKLPSLCTEKYACMLFFGHCCLENSRVVIHMRSCCPIEHHFYCFDGTAKTWTRHRFSGLPLFYDMDEDYDFLEVDLTGIKHLTGVYSAEVQNYALFLHPINGKLSVFDFSAVFKLLENPEVAQNCLYEYPYFTVAVDQPHGLKDFDLFGSESFKMWKTYELGAKGFCCVGFFEHGEDLHVCICTLDLKKTMESDVQISNSKTDFSVRNDIANIYRVRGDIRTVPNNRI